MMAHLLSIITTGTSESAEGTCCISDYWLRVYRAYVMSTAAQSQDYDQLTNHFWFTWIYRDDNIIKVNIEKKNIAL